MGRPQLPIWKEFATTVPSSDEKRAPDVACLHCREQVRNARPANLLRHVLNCGEMPDDVRLRITSLRPPAPAQLVTRVELEAAMAGQQQNQSYSDSEDGREGETEAAAAPLTTTTSRPVLGKRPRASLPNSNSGQDHLERVLTSIRDVMAESLDCKRQELQLRRDELEFRKEALATKLEDRRQARDEERRSAREQREADRQERLELARIENEKNLAFLKAVMESSAQRRA